METDVEQSLELDLIVPDGANERRGHAAFHGLELRNQRGNVIGGMLGIKKNPVKAGERQYFSDNIAGQIAP